MFANISAEYDPKHELPLGGYATLVSTFGAAMSTVLIFTPPKSLRFEPSSLLLLGVSTYQLARLLAKDRVLAPFRAPFTKYQGPLGAGEINEEARGTGLQKAIGELITCPYCLAPWVATAMSVAWIAAPRKTRWLAGVITIAAISDVCQQLYAALRKLST